MSDHVKPTSAEVEEVLLSLANQAYWHGAQAAQHDSLYHGNLTEDYQPLTPATQAIIRLIQQAELQGRIDELSATSHTEHSSTSKGEIKPGAGFNLIPNRIEELQAQLAEASGVEDEAA